MSHSSTRIPLLLVIVVLGCKERKAEEEATTIVPHRVDQRGAVTLTPAERAALDLQTIPARREKIGTRMLRFGKASARPEEQSTIVAPVTARLSGPPSVTLGADVAQGDALLAIEPLVDSASRAGLGAQRRELQGQLEGSRARVQALRTELDRVNTLVSSQLATESDRARARAELQAEESRLESLRRAGGEIATATAGSMTLRAPMAGTVASLNANVGALIQQGDVIARIVRVGPRWIDVAAAPSDELGSNYRVRTSSAWVSARLLNAGSVVQPDGTRQDRIEIAPPESSRVLPGATVAVEVVRDVEGIVVPEEAIVLRGAQPIVFVEGADSSFVARDVAIAGRDSGRAVISSTGLEPGTRIVVRGAMALLGEIGLASEGQERAPEGGAP